EAGLADDDIAGGDQVGVVLLVHAHQPHVRREVAVWSKLLLRGDEMVPAQPAEPAGVQAPEPEAAEGEQNRAVAGPEAEPGAEQRARSGWGPGDQRHIAN